MSSTNPHDARPGQPPDPDPLRSTAIDVATHSALEEDLWSVAEAMREAMRRNSGTNNKPPRTTTITSAHSRGEQQPQQEEEEEEGPVLARTDLPSDPQPSTTISSAKSAYSTITTTSNTDRPLSRPTTAGSDPYASGSESDDKLGFTSSTVAAAAAAADAVAASFLERDRALEQELGLDLSVGYPASVTSSIREHEFDGGLRYHAYRSGRYAFPNDEMEQSRDDMKHTVMLMLCRGRYFYSPVKEVLEQGGEVLDLGRFLFSLWFLDSS